MSGLGISSWSLWPIAGLLDPVHDNFACMFLFVAFWPPSARVTLTQAASTDRKTPADRNTTLLIGILIGILDYSSRSWVHSYIAGEVKLRCLSLLISPYSWEGRTKYLVLT